MCSVMEFEKNTPPTPDEQTLSEVPHVTVEPEHRNVAPDLTDAPGLGTAEAEQTFKFDTESTELAAASAPHSSHRVAVVIGIAIAVIFVAALVGLSFLLR